MYDEEDLEDELDESILDEDEDPAEDIALTRTMTQPPINGLALQGRLDSLGTESSLARGLISDVQRMQQTLGDADATLADLGADIEASLRVQFLEFAQNPAAVLLGVLSTMEPARQWRQIERCEELLKQRKARLFTQAMLNVSWSREESH